MNEPREPADADAYEELLERLADRLQAGERLDAAALAAEHPQFALRLEALLPVMQAMQEMRASEGNDEPADADESNRLLGQILGGCRMLRLLGRGGSSLVFEAMHPKRGLVALKTLSARAARDPRQVEVFWHAGQVARRLRHPRIVPAFEVGECQGRCFAVLKLIPGSSLAVRIAEQWMRVAHVDRGEAGAADSADAQAWLLRSVRWMIEAAEAVHAAHEQGIVHGDLKPANLLLDPREGLWATDFGGAANLDSAPAVATLRYLSPERLIGPGIASVASDVYALGATCYELIALEPAFAAFSPQRLRGSILRDLPGSLREYDANVPAALDALVLGCLAKDPRVRPVSARAFADALRDEFPTACEASPVYKIEPGHAGADLRPWGRAGRNGP